MNLTKIQRPKKTREQKGSILVGVLWCLAILAVVVIGGLHSARMDLMISKHHADRVRAHYLALAGIEKTKALLFHDAADRRRSGRNFSDRLFNNEMEFNEVALAGGQFRVFRSPKDNEQGVMVYGVSDEESRLNINQASAEEMAKLPGMTPQLAARIVDYRDADQNISPGGAEAEAYASMSPPYLPRNGPFTTTTELLSVLGFTRELVVGEDHNFNGLLDPDEDNGDQTPPEDNQDGVLDAGLSSLVTVSSTVSEVNAKGESRLDIQSATESDFQLLNAVSSQLAKAIVEYREQNNFESIADLLEVRAMQNNEGGGNNPSARPRGGGGPIASNPSNPTSPSNASSPTGNTLINKELLISIADDLTVGSDTVRAGVININTAPRKVLECLPGLDQRLADEIVRYRSSSGYFQNTAEILNVSGITTEIFKQLAPKICVRSETFRILSEGKSGSSGARKRIQVVVHIGEYEIETLGYKEDL